MCVVVCVCTTLVLYAGREKEEQLGLVPLPFQPVPFSLSLPCIV